MAAIVSMGLNKLMRRRVSGSVATRVTMRATLVQLREDEDETTSVRAITLHCELKIGRGDPTGLLYGRVRARGGSHASQTHEDQTQTILKTIYAGPCIGIYQS